MDRITADTWQRVEALLDQALSFPAEERTVFLQNACKREPDLRTLLMDLWSAGKEAEELLDYQYPDAIKQAFEDISFEDVLVPSLPNGTRLGEYRVLDEIGRGGVSSLKFTIYP